MNTEKLKAIVCFQFLTSHKKRAQDSATAFYQSLFNQNPDKDLPIVQTSDDRFYVSTEHLKKAKLS